MTGFNDERTMLLSRACFIVLYEFAFCDQVLPDDIERRISTFRTSISIVFEEISPLWISNRSDVLVNFILLFEGVSAFRQTNYEFTVEELDNFWAIREQIKIATHRDQAIETILQLIH